jgi:hypothetical protein
MRRFIFLLIADILLLNLAEDGDFGKVRFVSLPNLGEHQIKDDSRDVQIYLPPNFLDKISYPGLNQLVIPYLNPILTITYFFYSSSSGGIPL